MPLPELPHILDLPSLEGVVQTEVLDLLFEPSPEIHNSLLPVVKSAQYSSYPQLIDACHVALSSLATGSSREDPNPALLLVLGSHPRLGAKKVASAQSVAEQARLGGESEELTRLNDEYERTFPGLRYVVFVNGRGRPEIMENMKMRIAQNDFDKEVHYALQAMCDIAKDRASKLPEQDKSLR